MTIIKSIKITSISHITLICKDLTKTTKMLKKVFGAKEIYSSGSNTFSISKEKFFDIAGIWICIMAATKKNPSSLARTYNHIAFQVAAKNLPFFTKKIKELGLEIRTSRSRKKAEGKSLYFYDYDNHLFELHAGSLATRLKFYNT